MRMWKINPSLLCDKHLRGEHYEMHMFAGAIAKGKSIKGYLDKGLVETDKIIARHDTLASEMLKRGFKHIKPMPAFSIGKHGHVDTSKSIEDLKQRCEECRNKLNKCAI